MATVEIRMLGDFEIRVNGRPVLAQLAQSRKATALVQYLVLQRGERVSHKTITDTLWAGERSTNPDMALRAILHRFRNMIEAEGLTAATVGDSSALAVGEQVVAVGNPLGQLGGTVTDGIVSALNRSVSIQNSGAVNTMSLVQMSASVSPGNSGGGLFNMAGELIGIVNAKSSDSEAEGLGFAIPVNDAVEVAQELLENGYVTGRPYLGITYLSVTDAQTAHKLGVSAYGIYVMDVVKGGPADKAGIQPGDRIISVDGSEIAQQTDLGNVIQQYSAGDVLEITVARDGQMTTLQLTLGEKDAPAQNQQN